MMVTAHRPQHHAQLQIDATIGAIIVAVVGVLTAFVTGLWQYIPGRKKSNAEAGKTAADAHAVMVSGFVQLLNEAESDRNALRAEVTELRKASEKRDRFISRMIRVLHEHNIDIPEDGA